MKPLCGWDRKREVIVQWSENIRPQSVPCPTQRSGALIFVSPQDPPSLDPHLDEPYKSDFKFRAASRSQPGYRCCETRRQKIPRCARIRLPRCLVWIPRICKTLPSEDVDDPPRARTPVSWESTVKTPAQLAESRSPRSTSAPRSIVHESVSGSVGQHKLMPRTPLCTPYGV